MPSPTMPDASRWKPTCPCPVIRRSSSSVTSSAATTCREWLRTPCRAESTLRPAFVAISPASLRRSYRYRDLGSAAYISRGHALLQAGPVKLAGFAGWLGWELIHIAFLTGLENRVSTLATWLGTIARARRTDRTFTLGSTTSPEHPYTWLKFMHPNMLEPKPHSAEAPPMQQQRVIRRGAKTAR